MGKRRTIQQWRALVDDWYNGVLTVREFCEREGISSSDLYKYKKQFYGNSSPPPKYPIPKQNKTKQIKTKQMPIIIYDDVVWLAKLWQYLENNRSHYVKKSDRDKFRDIILSINSEVLT